MAREVLSARSVLGGTRGSDGAPGADPRAGAAGDAAGVDADARASGAVAGRCGCRPGRSHRPAGAWATPAAGSGSTAQRQAGRRGRGPGGTRGPRGRRRRGHRPGDPGSEGGLIDLGDHGISCGCRLDTPWGITTINRSTGRSHSPGGILSRHEGRPKGGEARSQRGLAHGTRPRLRAPLALRTGPADERRRTNVPSGDLQDLRQDHVGRLRAARGPGHAGSARRAAVLGAHPGDHEISRRLLLAVPSAPVADSATDSVIPPGGAAAWAAGPLPGGAAVRAHVQRMVILGSRAAPRSRSPAVRRGGRARGCRRVGGPAWR